MAALDHPRKRKFMRYLAVLLLMTSVENLLHALPRPAIYQRLMTTFVRNSAVIEITRVDSFSQNLVQGRDWNCLAGRGRSDRGARGWRPARAGVVGRIQHHHRSRRVRTRRPRPDKRRRGRPLLKRLGARNVRALLTVVSRSRLPDPSCSSPTSRPMSSFRRLEFYAQVRLGIRPRTSRRRIERRRTL